MKLYTIHNITHKARYEGWQGRSAKDVLARFANAEPYELLGDSLVEVQDEDGNTARFNVRLVPVIEEAKEGKR